MKIISLILLSVLAFCITSCAQVQYHGRFFDTNNVELTPGISSNYTGSVNFTNNANNFVGNFTVANAPTIKVTTTTGYTVATNGVWSLNRTEPDGGGLGGIRYVYTNAVDEDFIVWDLSLYPDNGWAYTDVPGGAGIYISYPYSAGASHTNWIENFGLGNEVDFQAKLNGTFIIKTNPAPIISQITIPASSGGIVDNSTDGYVGKQVRVNSDVGVGISGNSSAYYGIYGSSTSDAGVYGYSSGDVGVRGASTAGAGIYGYSSGDAGIYGYSTADAGVYGSSSAANRYGVYSDGNSFTTLTNFSGYFVGNGGGLTNLQSTNLVGILPMGTLTSATVTNGFLTTDGTTLSYSRNGQYLTNLNFVVSTNGFSEGQTNDNAILTGTTIASAIKSTGATLQLGEGNGLKWQLYAGGFQPNTDNGGSIGTTNQRVKSLWVGTGTNHFDGVSFFGTNNTASIDKDGNVTGNTVVVNNGSKSSTMSISGSALSITAPVSGQINMASSSVLIDAATGHVGLNTPATTSGNVELKAVGDCVFTGIITATNGFASFASNTVAPSSITFPASNANWTNTFSKNIFVFIDNAGVTGTVIKINGTQISSTLMTTGVATLPLQPNEFFSETYTIGTPTATWKPQ